MPDSYDITRIITNFAYFDSLPHDLKQEYMSTVQKTYHVSLTAIGRQMHGSPVEGTFQNYLLDNSVYGNRSEATKKTSPLWPAFCEGAADIYGNPIMDDDPPRTAPQNHRPSHLEITGAPKPLLNILSLLFSSPEILDASCYRITVQEVSAP